MISTARITIVASETTFKIKQVGGVVDRFDDDNDYDDGDGDDND